MLPEQRIDGSAQVLRVSHGTYQVVECVGFGGVLATTPDHRDTRPWAAAMLYRGTGVALESVGVSDTASGASTLTITITPAMLMMYIRTQMSTWLFRFL